MKTSIICVRPGRHINRLIFSSIDEKDNQHNSAVNLSGLFKRKICRQLLTMEDYCGLEYEFHIPGKFGYPVMLTFKAALSNHIALLINTISPSHEISKCGLFTFKRQCFGRVCFVFGGRLVVYT